MKNDKTMDFIIAMRFVLLCKKVYYFDFDWVWLTQRNWIGAKGRVWDENHGLVQWQSLLICLRCPTSCHSSKK